MHFLPMWLKTNSFSCGVSSIEPTFAGRRCAGCPLIIGDKFIKYALTLTRYMGPKKTHKQSPGHPWPPFDPPCTGSVYPGGPQDCGANKCVPFRSAMRRPAPL